MRLTGNTSIVELNSGLDGDVQRGVRARRRWRGLRDDLLNFVPFVNAPGIQWSLDDDDPPFAILEARFSDAQDGTPLDAASQRATNWSLDGNDLEKPLMQHPDLSVLTLSQRSFLKQAIKRLKDSDDDGTYDLEFSRFDQSVNDGALMAAFFDLAAQDVESFTVSQFVLRRTTTVPGSYTGSYATANSNKQFTKAQLQSLEVLPAALFFEIPAAGAWLKRTPSMRQLEDGRWEITSEWWHADRWSAVLYPAVS